MTRNRNANETREFETLEGLEELKLELSPKVFLRPEGSSPVTYTVGARQLYVLAELAGLAVALRSAESYDYPPERKQRLHTALHESLERFWDTPLDDSVIRENW